MREEKQMIEDLTEIFDEEYEKRRLITPQNTAEKMTAKGYRKQSEGEWIDKPTGAYGRMQSWCSACGKHSGIGGIESNRHKPFCPNCGAKMKGV
jgi:hypothetical protein